MPTWKAYFQINGYDYSRYPVIDFPVPEDLYADIQTALSENRPLRDCPFHDELLRLANDALNLDDYRPDYADLFPDLAGVVIASCVIEDPGDLSRLEDRIRGLRLPDPETRLENEDFTRLYWVTVTFDADERVERVVDVQAEGIASESAHSVPTERCYPDYEFIAAELKRLAGEEGA